MQRYSNTVVLQGPFRTPECFVVRAHDDKVSFWKFVCYLAVHCGPMLYCHLYFWQLPSFSESIQVGHGRYGPSKQTAARRNSWQTSRGLDQQWTPLRSPPLVPGTTSWFISSFSFPGFSRSAAASWRSRYSYTFAVCTTCFFWNSFIARCLDVRSVHKYHLGFCHSVMQRFVWDMLKDSLA